MDQNDNDDSDKWKISEDSNTIRDMANPLAEVKAEVLGGDNFCYPNT